MKSGKMYTLPTKTKAYKAMKASILAAHVSTEPAAEPSVQKSMEPEPESSESVPPASISITMTPDEYYAYRSAKESTDASQ